MRGVRGGSGDGGGTFAAYVGKKAAGGGLGARLRRS